MEVEGTSGESLQENTGQEPGQENAVGPGKPPVHTRFGVRPQPDPEKQKATKKKNREIREMFKEMLNLPYRFADDSNVKKQLEQAFGKKAVKGKTLAQIMFLMQGNKAVLSGSEQSFNSAINQAIGMPKAQHELTGKDGSELFQNKTEEELRAMLGEMLQKLK